MEVAIIDYGSGNLRSATKAFERAASEGGTGARILLTSDPETVANADRVVLPGVGAFADCRGGLAAVPGMEDALQPPSRKRPGHFSASVSACKCWLAVAKKGCYRD